MRRIPELALLITATIVITPEALAQVQAAQADAVFVIGAEKTASSTVWSKTYTKEELAEKVPVNPVLTIEDRIGGEITQLFRRLTTNQTKAAPWKNLQTAQPDEDTYNVQLGALKEEPSTGSANIDEVRARFAGETQKAMTERVKSEFTIFNRVTSGFGFNLDVGKMFEDKDPKAPKTTSGTVRYGLVLKDIVPVEAPDRAALGDSTEELRYAGHADVQWTIGPLSEEQGRRLFELKEKEAEVAKTSSFWSRFIVPKLAFKGKAAPEGLDNLAGVKAEALPDWRVDFAQQDDLYALVYRTKTSGEKISSEHQLRVPVAGTVALGRRFDDNFKIVQTSVYNVLFDQRLPLVSFHQMHLEERVKADLTYRVEQHAVTLAAQSEAKGIVAKEANRPEAYSVEYGHDF